MNALIKIGLAVFVGIISGVTWTAITKVASSIRIRVCLVLVPRGGAVIAGIS